MLLRWTLAVFCVFTFGILGSPEFADRTDALGFFFVKSLSQITFLCAEQQQRS